MMGIPTEEWDYLPSPGLMFYHTSPQEVLQMKLITDKVQEVLSRNKHNANIMHVGDTILDDAAEAIIDENVCHIDNQSTCNPFINGKYLSKIIDAPERQYIRVHFHEGVTYTNKIGDLPGY